MSRQYVSLLSVKDFKPFVPNGLCPSCKKKKINEQILQDACIFTRDINCKKRSWFVKEKKYLSEKLKNLINVQ